MRKKATDDGWIRYLSHETGVPEETVRSVWDAMKRGIIEYVGMSGRGVLSIPDFGIFERRRHRGHFLNCRDGSRVAVNDYQVLRFCPSESFKSKVFEE